MQISYCAAGGRVAHRNGTSYNRTAWDIEAETSVLPKWIVINENLRRKGCERKNDVTANLPPDWLAMLRKLLPPTGVAAEFEDDSLGESRNFGTGEDLGSHRGQFVAKEIPPHSARLLSCARSEF